MNRKRISPLLSRTALALACLGALSAQAAATINFGEDQSATFGLGLRTSYDSTGGEGQATGQSFNVDNLRLYTNFSLSKTVKATFNTEYNSATNAVSVLDAYAQIEPMESFNFWIGRLLPPSDRSNMDGPFYLNVWSYPGVASVYPEQYLDGRDQGATIWGVVADQRLTYAVGGFQGRESSSTNNSGRGGSKNLMFTARLNYNFWDTMLDPAYYASSTYYGTKDVLAVGLAGMSQHNGVSTATGTTADYKAWNADFLLEKKVLDGGAFTMEGAYYKVDTQNTLDSYCSVAATADCWGGAVAQGTSHLGTVAFLFPKKIGWGKVQPFYRYQDFKPDGVDSGTGLGQTVRSQKNDVGFNYVIKGHDARISVVYEQTNKQGAPSINAFIIGGQLQF